MSILDISMLCMIAFMIFFDELNISPTFPLFSSNNINSFYVDSTGACSLIDHFVISSSLINSVTILEIVDSGANLSDHCAVELHLNVPANKVKSNVSNNRNQSTTYCLRWDKANLALYFCMSLTGLNNIKVPWYLLYADSSTDKSEIMNDINSFYKSIVSILLSTADSLVPKRKSNFYKFWWDMELDLLKEESIEKHKVWSSLGRPRMGPYFLEMHRS